LLSISLQTKAVTNHTLIESFEYAHFLVFFVALALILQALAITGTANVVKRWCHHSQSQTLLLLHEKVQARQHHRLPLQLWFDCMFKLLSVLFIHANELPSELNFASYYGMVQDKVVVGVMDIDISSWIAFVGFLGINVGLQYHDLVVTDDSPARNNSNPHHTGENSSNSTELSANMVGMEESVVEFAFAGWIATCTLFLAVLWARRRVARMVESVFGHIGHDHQSDKLDSALLCAEEKMIEYEETEHSMSHTELKAVLTDIEHETAVETGKHESTSDTVNAKMLIDGVAELKDGVLKLGKAAAKQGVASAAAVASAAGGGVASAAGGIRTAGGKMNGAVQAGKRRASFVAGMGSNNRVVPMPRATSDEVESQPEPRKASYNVFHKSNVQQPPHVSFRDDGDNSKSDNGSGLHIDGMDADSNGWATMNTNMPEVYSTGKGDIPRKKSDNSALDALDEQGWSRSDGTESTTSPVLPFPVSMRAFKRMSPSKKAGQLREHRMTVLKRGHLDGVTVTPREIWVSNKIIDMLMLLNCCYIAVYICSFAALTESFSHSVLYTLFLLSPYLINMTILIPALIFCFSLIRSICKLEPYLLGTVLERSDEVSTLMADVHAKITMRLTKIGMSRKDVRKVFSDIDTDNSGHIDRREFRDALRELHVFLSQATFDRLFRAVDADCSGDISYDEFQEILFERDTDADAVQHQLESTLLAKTSIEDKKRYVNAVTRGVSAYW